MTSTVRHDGIAPAEPELRRGAVVVGICTTRDAEYERALRAASDWAGRRDVDVLLLTGVGEPDPDHPQDDSAVRFALAEIDRAAEHLALQLAPHQRIHTQTVPGSGVAALVAASTSAGLVVLQRRRMGPLSRLRAGSTTAAVAAQAACPVLVVHSNDDLVPDPASDRAGVLVGVDDRGHAASAIAAAFEEASFRGACLTAVLVWEPVGATFVPPDESELAASRATYGSRLAEQLAGYRDRYPDVVVHRLVLPGDTEDVLAELSGGHELLVVARHTDGHGVRRNLGSVTRRIIEDAHCPVLVTAAGRPPTVSRHRQSDHG